MDSGGKGPAPWLCQGPKRESRQGTKRPEPEGGAVEGGAAPRSLQVWGRAGLLEKMGDTRDTSDTPEGMWAAAVCCSGERWVSPVYGWCLEQQDPRPWPIAEAPFPAFRHSSIGHRRPLPPVLSLQGWQAAPGSVGFMDHTFLKAWVQSSVSSSVC